jgi:hypothetical protein
VRRNLSVVLICISFMAKDIEYFFMYFYWVLQFNCSFLHWSICSFAV